ncbi:MAG: UDP-N-acetylglucosamine diphosphorylase/glucosamine-1-phosphate N-acetyltransferase [Marinoscillum sp.]|jgi:UDP-N-acetylglucosamine diphosphorylase/glucosamine-1-phosphate N-acetyltransferase
MTLLFAEIPQAHQQLLPLTYTRPIADLRVGILTIAEKWSAHLQIESKGFITETYLQTKYPPQASTVDTIWICNGILPNGVLLGAVQKLNSGDALVLENKVLVACGSSNPLTDLSNYQKIDFSEVIDEVVYSWDIFRLNGQEIRNDYQLLTKGRTSQPITDQHTKTYGTDIFLEKGAQVKAAILNAEEGPIYLGADSKVEEGAIIRGPFGLGEHSVVNMGAKIRGDSSTGPYCKLGGEVSNSVFWGYSNKGHDGFLGNAVIGEWCNIGADTNNSNLKNNYDPVRMWDYSTEKFIHTGLQFCGLIMADHSKTGINTMFNTGTTIGVAANIYGEGFPRNIIPSFAWGGASGFVTHQPRKAFITADIVMQRRKLNLTQTDKDILNHIFEVSSRYRVWENA